MFFFLSQEDIYFSRSMQVQGPTPYLDRQAVINPDRTVVASSGTEARSLALEVFRETEGQVLHHIIILEFLTVCKGLQANFMIPSTSTSN